MGSNILRIAYGYDVQDHDDPFVRNVDVAMDEFTKIAKPGVFLVDNIPWRASFTLISIQLQCTPSVKWTYENINTVKYVPEWFPGI